MTEYSDIKVSPILRDVLEDAAQQQYGTSHRSISRAGHEAVIAWLTMRVDDDVRRNALEANGYESIDGLIADLAAYDGEDGRFKGDDHFDPLAAVRTPQTLPDADDCGGWPRGLYQIADNPPTAIPLSVEDGSGDHGLLEEVLADHGFEPVDGGDA